MATGNAHDPARCLVTVYACCQRKVNRRPGGAHSYPERGHQCYDAPVKDGLCLRHLGDRVRLLKRV